MLRNLATAATMVAACTSSFATTAFVQARFGTDISVTDLRPLDDIAAGWSGNVSGSSGDDHFSIGPATDFSSFSGTSGNGSSALYILTTTGPDAMAYASANISAGWYTLTPYSSVTLNTSFFAGLSESTNLHETGEINLGLLAGWFDEAQSTQDLRTLTFGQNFDGALSVTLVNDSPLARDFGWSSYLAMNLNVPAVTAPVPEPETYALMLAGLGLVGWQARRRRGAAAAAPLALV